MKPICPSCRSLIPTAQLNIAADVAVCSNCGEITKLSSMVSSIDVPEAFDINDPPAGAWFQEDFQGWKLGATTRSYIAFFLVPFMCAWSGFSLGGIYGSQIMKGKFDLFMSLFGIPFILGTIVLGCIALMSICGKLQITVQDGVGKVFLGALGIGWTRKFNWNEISNIDETTTNVRHPGNLTGHQICLNGKTQICFGGELNNPRRYYLLQALKILRDRKA
jgi:hypothetical protein